MRTYGTCVSSARARSQRDDDARNRQFAVGTDRHLHNNRGVADEAAVRCHAETMSLRELAAPAGLARRLLDHASQSSRIERVTLRIFAIVPFVRHGGRVN